MNAQDNKKSIIYTLSGMALFSIQDGLIRPLVAEIYPLKQIGLAQESFNRKNFLGKIVLEISKRCSHRELSRPKKPNLIQARRPERLLKKFQPKTH